LPYHRLLPISVYNGLSSLLKTSPPICIGNCQWICAGAAWGIRIGTCPRRAIICALRLFLTLGALAAYMEKRAYHQCIYSVSLVLPYGVPRVETNRQGSPLPEDDILTANSCIVLLNKMTTQFPESYGSMHPPSAHSAPLTRAIYESDSELDEEARSFPSIS
jgi:hypothetical protein